MQLQFIYTENVHKLVGRSYEMVSLLALLLRMSSFTDTSSSGWMLILEYTALGLVTSNDLICDSWRECSYASLECADNEDCTIKCLASSACYGATIYCPSGFHCTIDCSRWMTCHYLVVDAQNAASLHVTCTGSERCDDSIIKCPQNGYRGTDGLCVVDGDSPIDGLTFYTEEGHVPWS